MKILVTGFDPFGG
ncbi:Protein of unknown function [Lactobacillus helveticus CIRM-BIA 101]|nr:Protein of unknown function [Lactobacillus helveticus CIRM-BIA 101]